jgi:capsule polysaccharide export protein KpsC/LpsZ
VLPDDVNIDSIIDKCGTIYTVSSQVGFEGLLRGKKVITFGMPFYSGWGLTEDRFPPPRRSVTRSVEDLFHVACIQLSLYVDGRTGKHIELENAIDMVLEMRAECAARALHVQARQQ